MLQANRDAHALLREHAAAYIRRNGSDATYAGWVALLHPENVRLDARLKSEECEHMRIWSAALETTASRAAEEPRPDLVELSVEAVFSLAVVSIDVALVLTDALLTKGSAAARIGRHACMHHAMENASVGIALVLLPPALIAAGVEAALEVGSAAVCLSGSLALATLTATGSLLHAVLTLSPAAGHRAAARLRTRAPHLHRRTLCLLGRASLAYEAARGRVMRKRRPSANVAAGDAKGDAKGAASSKAADFFSAANGRRAKVGFCAAGGPDGAEVQPVAEGQLLPVVAQEAIPVVEAVSVDEPPSGVDHEQKLIPRSATRSCDPS